MTPTEISVPSAPELVAAGEYEERSGNLRAAADYFWRAILADQNCGEAWNSLAIHARKAGALYAAIALYQRAVMSAPNQMTCRYWGNLGEACAMVGMKEEARIAYSHAMKYMAPDDPMRFVLVTNMALLKIDGAESVASLVQCDAMLAEAELMAPHSYLPPLNRVRTLLSLGRVDNAVDAGRRAVAAAPELAEAHWNLGCALGVAGDLAGALAEFEVRYDWANHQLRSLKPSDGVRWRGEDLGDKRLLVVAEQGVGDCIMFSRYLPELRAKYPDASIDLMVPDSLISLMQQSLRFTCYGPNDKPPRPDHWVYLGSLPFHLGTTTADLLDASDDAQPYLASSAARREAWRERFARYREKSAAVVGIVWRGSPHCAHDASRSIPVAALAGLGKSARNIAWVSLQVGAPFEDFVENPLPVADEAPRLTSWAETAAALDALDAVVVCDTGVAHLAGAMAIPTVLLLRPEGEWRWFRPDAPETQTRTLWYPSVSLVRRKVGESWEDIMPAAAATLENWLEAVC